MGRRLLIDYTKNTAPLQDDEDPQRLQVGISLRYHEPEMSLRELDESCKELGFRPRKAMAPNPRYPLQFLEKLEVETKPDLSDKRRKKSRSPQRTPSKIVTFRVPSRTIVRAKRNAKQYSNLHHSDTELTYFSNHSVPLQGAETTRESMISKDDTFAISVQTAPATAQSATATTSTSTSPLSANDQSIPSLGKAMQRISPKHSENEEEEEDMSDEEAKSSSFLPTALMDGSSSSLNSSRKSKATEQTKKKRKKKRGVRRNPSLDDWFNRGGSDSVASLTIEEAMNPEESDNYSTSRSSITSRSSWRKGSRDSKYSKKSLRSMFRRALSSESVTSQDSRQSRRSSLTSISSSRSYLGGGSCPTGPRRRMLPLRTKSFEDTHRMEDDNQSAQSTAASANTRRGGRRPGNRGRSPANGNAAPKRRMPAKTKSTESFRSLKSLENSFSFMAGSRIRVRHAGSADNNSRDEDEMSMVSSASTRRGRRGNMERAKSCENMPRLLRSPTR